MRIKLALVFLLVSTVPAFCQDKLAEALRKGIVEEEVNHNLNAAIQTYQGVVAQFDEARKTAAAALFRMAECYRKQGKNDQAVAAYKRVVQEFSDQAKLADQSRYVLARTYKLQLEQAAAVAAGAGRAQAARTTNAPNNVVEARERYRSILREEMQLVEQQIMEAQKRYELGINGPNEITNLQRQMLELRRDLAAFDLGRWEPSAPAASHK